VTLQCLFGPARCRWGTKHFLLLLLLSLRLCMCCESNVLSYCNADQLLVVVAVLASSFGFIFSALIVVFIRMCCCPTDSQPGTTKQLPPTDQRIEQRGIRVSSSLFEERTLLTLRSRGCMVLCMVG